MRGLPVVWSDPTTADLPLHDRKNAEQANSKSDEPEGGRLGYCYGHGHRAARYEPDESGLR